MGRNRPRPFMEEGRLVAALGRSHNFLSARRQSVLGKEALLLQRRRDLVQRSLGLVFVDGVHEIVEVVQLIVLVLPAFGSENFDSSDLETMRAFHLDADRRRPQRF